MIKGVENGNFEDELKAVLSPEERRPGGNLITIFMYRKVVMGKAGQLFSICTEKKKCT